MRLKGHKSVGRNALTRLKWQQFTKGNNELKNSMAGKQEWKDGMEETYTVNLLRF